MNVRELKEMLAEFDDEMDVEFAYNYGDHWHTTVTQRIDSIEYGVVEYSEYHRKNKLIETEDGEEMQAMMENAERNLVVVIR